jgi:arginyl-tRNA synthetase
MTYDIFADMRETVLAALRAELPDLPDELAAKSEVTPAREAAHGDMATNAAMVCARHAGRKPAELAQALAARLRSMPGVARAEPAGPGFINIDVAPEALLAVAPAALRAGERFGDGDVGGGLRVNVEYVSANPSGPLTVGHARGAVVGDALANLMAKAGYAVTKEYYINDSGRQMISLAWAAYWRYLQALGATLDEAEFSAHAPGGLQYRGEYMIPIGQRLAALHGDALAGPGLTVAEPALWLDTARDAAIADNMAEIREDLRLLGVEHAVFTSEAAVLASGAVDRALARMDAEGLIYEGVLEPPKGKTPDDWEPRPQTLFRSTRYGDDVDRPLRKSDGSNTYFANDIAYHNDKLERGAELLIDVLGADHGGYVKRMQAATAALGGRLDIVLCQIVHVVRGGVPVRMSKRAGTYVTLRDLLEEVGRDAVRFTMLTRKADAQMEFDLDAVVAQTRDNPVFYVQYAHARCRSVLRAAAEMFPGQITDAALAEAPTDSLTAEPELAVLRRLAAWPRTVQGAALAREPHRIAFYLYDLAGDFHMLWNRGKDDSTLRFLQADRPAPTLARAALVAAVATVIRSGLAVMGVAPAEEMR